MFDLKPSTKYFYNYGTEESNKQAHFISPPDSNAEDTRIIFFADMAYNNQPKWRSYETGRRTKEDILGKFKASLVIHAGDLSYSMGWSWAWEHWQAIVEEYASYAPYIVAAGNHEYDYVGSYNPPWGNFNDDSGGEKGVPTKQRFALLRNGFYYSVNHGLFHIIVICTETSLEPGSKQYLWLEEDLKSVDRELTPWIIITGHRSMYVSGGNYDQGDITVVNHLREFLEPLTNKFKVDLGLWGHFHHYERFCARINDTKCDKNGMTHIIAGTAGADLDDEMQWSSTSVSHALEWGILRLNATPQNVIGEFVLNKDKSIFDRFIVNKRI